MSKRGRGNVDVHKDNFEEVDAQEAEEAEEESSAGFRKADDSVLATRQIFRAKRTTKTDGAASGSIGGTGAFSGFSGLKPAGGTDKPAFSFGAQSTAAGDTAKPAGDAPKPASPFASTAAKEDKPSSPFSFGASKPAAAPSGASTAAPFSFGGTKTSSPTAAATAPTAAIAPAASFSFGKTCEMKQSDLANMEALNAAFAEWISAQVKRHGVLDFSAACKQYIEYRNEICSSSTASASASNGAPASPFAMGGGLPSFTSATAVPKADTSFFAKQSALPFAPKMPSPLTDLGAKRDAPAPAASTAATSTENAGDEEDINPEDAKPKAFQDDEERERPGEEDESNLYSKRCKLHFLYKEKDDGGKPKGPGEWKQIGFGEVRVNKFDKGDNAGKYRVLVREESSTQKLVLNSFLLASMDPKLQGKNKVALIVPKTSEKGATEMVPYLITVKSTEDAKALIDTINSHKPKE